MASGANENSGEDMAPVMARFDRVAHASGAAMCVIHHNGKNQAAGARGWSGIRAHIDTEIEVVSDDVTRCAVVTKQRELAGKGDEIFFRLEVMQLGPGKFGTPQTTCVAVPDGEAVKRPEGGKAKPNKLREAQDVLERAWKASGRPKQGDVPYITRNSIVALLTADGDISKGTIEKKLKPSVEGGWIAPLLRANQISAYGTGWIVANPVWSSAMMLTK
jgi:hypothetical protein